MKSNTRSVTAGLMVLAAALFAANPMAAEALYYKEIRKDDRIYVFNSADEAERFEKSGEMGRAITMIGAGPGGETVVGDSEKALQLFFFKHGLAVPVADPPPPPAPVPPWRISGLVFGDYYGFAESHEAAWEGQHGFWLRRVYLTYDHTWTPKLTTRLRLEMNSNGTLAGGTLTPYVKDAYLRWTFYGRQQVFLGIQPTATLNFIEEVWGLRHIEKTPDDLYSVDGSRDFGVGVQGPVGDTGNFQYVAQYGNESGQGSETDKYKATRLGFRFAPAAGLAAEFIYFHANRAQDADRQTIQGFGGWRGKQFRAGFQYTHQVRELASTATSGSDTELDLYSGFAVFDVKRETLSVFGRFDRVDDPNPGAAGIAYLPIDPRVPYTFGLLGVEYYVHPKVRFGPNVEWVVYDDLPNGTPVDKDVVGRVTFYWVFP
jgi:hypothetical protein